MTDPQSQTLEEEFISRVGEKLDAHGIKVISGGDPYYELLKAKFPIDMSRIDWHMVPDATFSSIRIVSSFYGVDRYMACKAFFTEQIAIHDLNGKAYLVNDGFDLVLAGEVPSFERIFESLLWPSGHIYLIEATGKWCLNVTFEGDLWFGYSASSETSIQ
jgi:hypothetical protein